MQAYLTSKDESYYLDWNNNPIDSEPLLYVNGTSTNQWSIIDIFLDVIRLNKSPFIIKYNNIELRNRFAKCHKSFMDLGYTYGFDINLPSHMIDDNVEDITLCNLWDNLLIVTNIG